MNFESFCERALMAKRKSFYKYKNYCIYHENNIVTLKHYYAPVISVEKKTGKIVYADSNFSFSDRRSTYTFTKVFQRVFKTKVEDYIFVHNKIYLGEELERIRRRRDSFRKSLLKKLTSYPNATLSLRELGFEVIYVSEEEWKNVFKSLRDKSLYIHFLRPNKLYLRVSSEGKIVVTHKEYRLGATTLKLVYFNPINYGFKLLDVRLAGKDETGQLWSLRLPLGYYLAGIQACEKWLLSIPPYEEYEVLG
ncbi:MAG: hypothetical protein ACP5IT_10740 [Thermoproteota archaeon]